MRAVLIDDEQLALDYFEKLLQEIGSFKIVAKYINPRHALEEVAQERPDVIFLDIEMPEINGIELAEQFGEIMPNTQIVFITAYDEYAVKAFELNAVDYILKPVHRDRLV